MPRSSACRPFPNAPFPTRGRAAISGHGLHHQAAAVFRRRRRAGHGLARRAEPVDLAVLRHRGDQGTGERSWRRAVRAPSARTEHHPQGPSVPAPCDQDPGRRLGRAAHLLQRSRGDHAAACSSASPRWSPAMCCPTCSPATAAPIPAVEVSAIEDNGDYLEHLLVGGELDIAVMVISNLRDRMALQSEILEISPYRLWLPLGHPLAAAEIINLADIAGEPLIMLTVDEIEENTGKLLAALGARPACRLPHPLGRGGAQPRRHRRRRRAAARPCLSALVAGRRPHRVAATFPARFPSCRSAWSGGAARPCRRRRATSSASRRPSGPSGSAPETGYRKFRYHPSDK